MAIQSRTQLKSWFETGDKPTQDQFHHWIDSYFHLSEDMLLLSNYVTTSYFSSEISNYIPTVSIVDNLITANANLPLSANQGVVLKGLIDSLSLEWGNITGDITDQTDLNNALIAKADATHTHSYLPLSGGTVSGNLTVQGIVNLTGLQSYTNTDQRVVMTVPASGYLAYRTLDLDRILSWGNASTLGISVGQITSSSLTGTDNRLLYSTPFGILSKATLGTGLSFVNGVLSAVVASGSATWGGITGTLSDQTDLQAAIDSKADTSHTHVTADITNFSTTFNSLFGAKTLDDLSNVDETGKSAGDILKWNGTSWIADTEAGASIAWGAITGTLSSQTDLQTALNGKAATSHTHVTTDVTNFSTTFNTLFGAKNIADLNDVDDSGRASGQVLKWSGTNWTAQDETGGVAAWGAITGTLADQTDLQSAINAKANASHTHVTANITNFSTTFDSLFGAKALDALGNVSETGKVVGSLLKWNGTNWAPGSTYETFVSLTDTPASYSTHGSKFVRVNAGATALEFIALAIVATTGSYNDLSNKPTIPTAQVNSDWNSVSGVSQILNKPTILTTLDSLTDATITTPATTHYLGYNGSIWVNRQIAYSQLSGTPTIPAAQINSDWNSSSGLSQILNKPTIPAAQVNSDWNAVAGISAILNKPTFAGVAYSGDYDDLFGKPTIYSTLASLSDTTISAPATNHYLGWNGSSWVNRQISYSQISGTLSVNLDDLADVSATTPINGETIIWNSTSSLWTRQLPSILQASRPNNTAIDLDLTPNAGKFEWFHLESSTISSVTNKPSSMSSSYDCDFVMGSQGNGEGFQMAFQRESMWYRTKTNTTWNSWHLVSQTTD